MKVTPFDPLDDLIIVPARVDGPNGSLRARLALDTGSSETVVKAELIDMLGYSPRDGEAMTTVRAAVGKEHGYTLKVERFVALGYTVADFRLHVFDLPDGFGIDGLIGLSYLRQFNYQVRSAEGRLLVERTTG
ncbi:MAG: clan AA aspartic protease [Myxococcales bacterium]|nr:clan AA aspartic protease [Myxococcales bacterium]